MTIKTINKSIILYLFFLFVTLSSITIFAKADTLTGDIDTNKIDDYINSRIKSQKIPGCSVAVVKGDKILYIKGYGVDGNHKPVTAQTPFILGSVSKSFTGLAIAQLIDKGKIDIDAPVQKYLPWFTFADKADSERITIKRLLTHTSGISTYDGDEVLLYDNTQREQLIRNLKNKKLSYLPGTKFEYSNINYIILGEVVQVVSGMPYEQYIQQQIFNPLNMKHSYTSITSAYKNDLPYGYKSYLGFILPTKTPNHEGSIPAGFLSSSAEDMAHYLIAEINDGKYNNNSIISKEGMVLTHSDIAASYGMGWFVNNSSNIYHGGDVETFHTNVIMDTNLKLGIVMLYNVNDFITVCLLNKGAYDDISNNVLKIVKGQQVIGNAGSKISLYLSLINAAMIIVSILLIISFLRIFKWKKKISTNKVSKLDILILIVINVIIPLTISILVLGLYNRLLNNHSIIFEIRIINWALPDLGLLLVLTPIVLFSLGIIKGIFLTLYIKNKKYVPSAKI